jgi:hypothetical protein
MPVDPKTLRITPLGEGDPTQLPERGDRPIIGVLIGSYGCYVNPSDITKAQQLCDGIAQAWFMVLSTNPATGGAHWPEPAPATAERFGLR